MDSGMLSVGSAALRGDRGLVGDVGGSWVESEASAEARVAQATAAGSMLTPGRGAQSARMSMLIPTADLVQREG
jgi:hypothetical protein